MQAMWEFVNSYNGHCHFTTVPQSIFSLSSCQEFLMFWDFNWQVLMAVSLQAVSSKVISDMVFSTTLSCLKWILRLSGMGIFEQSLLLISQPGFYPLDKYYGFLGAETLSAYFRFFMNTWTFHCLSKAWSTDIPKTKEKRNLLRFCTENLREDLCALVSRTKYTKIESRIS